MEKYKQQPTVCYQLKSVKMSNNMLNPTFYLAEISKKVGVMLLFMFMVMSPFYMRAQVTISLDYREKNSLTTIQSGDLYTMQLDYSVSSTTGNATGVKAVINLPDNIYGLSNYTGTVHAPISNFVFDDTPGAKKLTITFVSPLASGSTGVVEFGIRTNNLTTLNGTVLTTNAEITATGGYSSGVDTHNMTVTAAPRICAQKTLLGGGALNNVTTYRIQVYAGGYSNHVPLGTLQATNITLKDTLPAGAQYVSAQIYSLSGILVGNGTESGGIVTAAIPDLSYYVLDYTNTWQSQFYYVDISVQYNTPTFSSGNVVINKAAVLYTPYSGTPDTLRNGDNVGGCTSDLRDTLTLSAPVVTANFANNGNCGNVYPANRFEYYMGFSNTGNVGLDNVEIIDSIPSNIRIDATASYRGVRFDAMGYLNHVEYQTNVSGTTWISHTPPNGYQVVPLLPSGEYFTKLKFVLNSPLASGITLPGYHALTFIPASIPVSAETVTNCMYWNSTTSGIPNLAARTICNTCYVLQPRPTTARILYRVGNAPSCGSNLAIGQDITFTGTVTADVGYSDAQNPIAVMFVPSGYQFLTQSFNALTSGLGTAPTLQIIPNYITRGGIVKDLYRWTFPSGTTLPYGTEFSVSATVRVTGLLQAGSNYITDFLATSPNASIHRPENVWAGSITDTGDLDADLNTLEQFQITTNDYCCWACHVSSSASMESIKWVKGQCDSTYSRYPDYGQTMPGGKADYRLVVKNTGNVPMKDIKIIDILPFVGDRGVIDPSDRLSEWRPNLAGPIAAPSGITVYYSTVSNPCRDEVKQPSDPSPFPTGCATANWTNIPPEDITQVQAVKIDFGATILAGSDSLVLLWPMRAPVDAPTTNEVAWNSFGYVATRTDNNQPLIAAEPIKVGIKLKPLAPAIYGNYVWNDANHNGIQEYNENGVSGVRVDIYKDNGNSIVEPNADLLYDFTITDDNGQYLFPTLLPGEYFAVFSPLSGYTVSPSNQGNNDELDSDGLIMPMTRLDAAEDDRSWDLGIYQASPCDLNITNYTISDCDWNGTASQVTVNVFVAWKNAPVGENIHVTLNGVTQTINVAAATTSQGLVSFIMTPNDTDYTITANFITTNTCSDNQLIHLPLACPPYNCALSIDKVNVGACDNGNAPLDVLVSWEGAPYNENIVVTANGQSKTILVKEMVESPVIVSFSVPADNSTNNPITASFTSTTACSDNATYDAPLCVGTVGNYVWTDTNGNGEQEFGETGINGVTVQLWNNTTNTLVSSTTTVNDVNGNAGYYNFVVTATGDYYVKFPTTSGNYIITKGTWQTNYDRDNDADVLTGQTINFPINVFSTGYDKDNPTLDAGYADCLKLSNLVVGACTNVDGKSMVKVDITVNVPSPSIFDWNNTLVITAGDLEFDLRPFDSYPKTISFLLPANGQSDSIVAKFIPTAALCNRVEKVFFTKPTACVTNPCGAAGTLGGFVFKDANGNGVRDANEQGTGTGVKNVTVTAFSTTGQIAQTTTDANGQYTLTGLTNGTTYRLEFTNYPSGWKPSTNGTQNGTDVQFVAAPNCNILFALMYPSDYCQDNPYILAGTYANGNPMGGGISGNIGWFYKWAYNAKDSVDGNTPTYGPQNNKTTFADSIFLGSQIGAVWGVAYNNEKKVAYTSSVLRRHAGYGPLGSGGIYKIDLSPTIPTISNWLNFDALGIPTGNAVINNSNRNLSVNPGVPNIDAAAYDGVGKYSFGGLEISDDHKKLFVVNLYDKKLYMIDISGTGTPTMANITSVAIPQTSCTSSNGNFRPWALKYYRGRVYVGGVCSGETQPYQPGFPDMTATVYSLDPANVGAGFTSVFTYPLDYRYYANWHTTFDYEWISSPMLTDLEFDADGSLILGMLDRKGYQLGVTNYTPDGSAFISAASSGDILRASNNNGVFTMEDDGVSGSLVGLGAGSTEPASSGRGFFQQMAPVGGIASGIPPVFSPAAQGALAMKPGTGEVITTMGDIVNYNSGGVGTLSTQNGQLKRGFELYYDNGGFGKMGKAAGIGDLELMCNAAPVEIGNYVWNDADKDGIQDPNETGIQGVTIRLYKSSGTLVGVTTTNVKGEYYFNTSNVDTTGVSVAGAPVTGFTGLNYNRPYYIVLGQGGQFANNALTVSSKNYLLTTANTGQGTNPDMNDSDGGVASGVNASVNGFPYISITSGEAGNTNHTYDFGFYNVGSVGNFVWNDDDKDGSQDAGELGINGVTVELWNNGTSSLVSSTTTANDASGNAGYYNFFISTNGNYYVKFPTTNNGKILTTQTSTAATDGNSDANASTGASPVFAIDVNGTGTAKDNATIDAGFKCNLTAAIAKSNDLTCPTPTATLTATPATGVSYLWDNGSTSATRVVSAAGTYSVTVTDTANGCSASANVTVTSTITNPPCTPINIQKTK